MQQLEQANFTGKKVLVRVDFNVPLNEAKVVTDATRINAAKPTIEYIRSQGGRCIIVTHLGRPKGNDPELSLQHIQGTVAQILGAEVYFSPATLVQKPWLLQIRLKMEKCCS